MIKFSRYNNFSELKSAGDFSKSADVAVFKEYKVFMDDLQRILAAKRTMRQKARKKSR